jgi:hypothetical protein
MYVRSLLYSSSVASFKVLKENRFCWRDRGGMSDFFLSSVKLSNKTKQSIVNGKFTCTSAAEAQEVAWKAPL